MLNEAEFLRVCAMHPETVYRTARGGSIQNAMRFLREFQESLARYAKTHPLDGVQHRALGILRVLDSKIYAAYAACKRKEMARGAVLLPPAKIKRAIRDDWEKFRRTIAY